jgi:peroxiredoxin
VVLTAVAVLLACNAFNAQALEVGEDAADFSLEDLNGRMVSLSNFRGKVIILDFFATWCPPCRSEISGFVELQKSYGRNDLVVVGVSKEGRKDLKDFAGATGINYPVLTDPMDAAHSLYGPIRAVPTTFVIDKEFRIVKKYIGAQPKKVFESDIVGLLR